MSLHGREGSSGERGCWLSGRDLPLTREGCSTGVACGDVMVSVWVSSKRLSRSSSMWINGIEWSPTAVLLPGKSHGQRSLVGCSPWGHQESDMTGDFTFNFHFHTLEEEMATHSSVLAWRIPGTGEPGGLPFMGSHRVGHNWSDLAAAATEVGGSSILSSCRKIFMFLRPLWLLVNRKAYLLLFSADQQLDLAHQLGGKFHLRSLRGSPYPAPDFAWIWVSYRVKP